MRKRAKPGPVFIQMPDGPRGEAIVELMGTLRHLDPDADRALRGQLGSVYLYITEADARGDGDEWYEEAPRDWQRQADTLFDHITSGLQKTAPAHHYFSGRKMPDGTIEWGFWEKVQKNPGEAAEDDLLYGGFRENKTPLTVQKDENGTIYKYRGRHILVQGPNIQIARQIKDGPGAVLAEWSSDQPFPHLEALAVIDLMHEQAKHRSRKRVPPQPPVPAGVRMRTVKGNGGLFACRSYTIDVQPLGAYEGGDIAEHDGMAMATVIGPDETALGSYTAWGARRALASACALVEKTAKERAASAPKKATRGSFMRRMMNI